MSTQEQINEVQRLGKELRNGNPAVRGNAAKGLSALLDQAWSDWSAGSRPPEVMPAFRLNTVPLLADAICLEPNHGTLQEMLQLAFNVAMKPRPIAVAWNGTSLQRLETADPVEVALAKALVERMVDSEFIPNGVEDPEFTRKGILLGQIADALCALGPSARMYGIQQSHQMTGLMERCNTVAHLASGGIMKQGGEIHSAALASLSDSVREEDWETLCHLGHIFEAKVPRGELKDALVKVWRKAQGQQKEDIAYTLRRRGFNQLFGFWM